MGTVRHNEARSRYELDTEHGVAIAVYSRQGDRLIFSHTEVPPESEGRGIGSQLVRFALDDARKRGLKIVPACSFVADFVCRHPEYESSGDQDA
ncbi:MAG: GNAT family N-acetyltransferase [Reyranella sp.]|nr:GNAT family N-acetyltransferase [Reyranella sp.]